MGVRGRTVTTSLVAAIVVTLAACGTQADPPSASSSSPSADPPATTAPAGDALEALLRQAARNSFDAPSKRLVGKASLGIVTQEFEVVFVGSDAKGRQVTKALGQESVVDFVRVGDSIYIHADEGYWQAYVRLENLAAVSGTWVRVSASHPGHSRLLVLENVVEIGGVVTQVGTDTVDGQPTVVLTDGSGRFHVSTGTTPYLLRAEGTKQTENGSARAEATFSDFGSVRETITAPTGKAVDLR